MSNKRIDRLESGSTVPKAPNNEVIWVNTGDNSVNRYDKNTSSWVSVGGSSNPAPLPSFLTYEEGMYHLPTLNQNFGWNSGGVWFGPTSDEEGESYSYPVYTSFTINGGQPVEVSFDVVINDECSDAGVALFLDGTRPIWSWGTDYSRIAVSFNCPEIYIYGQENQSDSYEVPGNGTYRVILKYDPNAEEEKVLLRLWTTGPNADQIFITHINETLPPGYYRIGFAADQDANNPGDPRTYIKNLDISVDNGNEVYSDSLTNGNSVGMADKFGKLSFADVQIIGGGKASGDGYGNGTLELVPDKNLYNNNQYLVVDPTSPNHIHIRAGGEQDSSMAELILGAEKANVKITDYNHQVEVNAYNSDTDSYYNWSFGNDGVFYGSKLSATNNDNTGENVQIGDDAWIGDVNVSNHIQVKGMQDPASAGVILGENGTETISTDGSNLSITSGNDMTITATGGNMQFYMDGGMYIGPVDSDNQILKRSDVAGANGSFTTNDGKTVTVSNGIITSIV